MQAISSDIALGLLFDPIYIMNRCNDHSNKRNCNFLPLDETSTYRTQLGLGNTPDGRWQPFGDTRIRAVLAIAPCTIDLMREEALTAVTTPTMIMHGTEDYRDC